MGKRKNRESKAGRMQTPLHSTHGAYAKRRRRKRMRRKERIMGREKKRKKKKSGNWRKRQRPS